MSELLNRLGFTEKKYRWTDFDMSVKKVFYIKILITVLILACSISLFTIKAFPGAIGSLIIAISVGGYCYYQYLYFTYGKFKYIVGDCVSVDKKTNDLFKRRYYERCTMTLLADDIYYQLPVRALDEIENGSKVIVYMSRSSMSQLNENTYRIDNPIAFSVLTHPSVH